jgi:peptidyl-dipeptidase Dcp
MYVKEVTMKMNSTIKLCTDFAVKGKKAKLLGPTFAHWNLSNKMAKTPERTMELMMSVWEPAVAQVHKDVASMQKIVDAEEEILKFLLGIIVIIRRKFERKIRSGPECRNTCN